MDGQAGHVLGLDFDLAGVQSGPDLDAELGDLIPDARGTADRPGWAVERGQDAIADRLHGTSAESLDLAPGQVIVLAEELPPAGIAQLRGELVDPTMSVNRTVASTRFGSGVGRTPVTKAAISADDRILVAGPDQVVGARQLEVGRTFDVRRQVAAVVRGEAERFGSVDDQRRTRIAGSTSRTSLS